MFDSRGLYLSMKNIIQKSWFSIWLHSIQNIIAYFHKLSQGLILKKGKIQFACKYVKQKIAICLMTAWR